MQARHGDVIMVLRAVLAAAVLTALAGCASPSARYLRAFESAEAAAQTFAPITEMQAGTDMADAYAMQRRIVARRLAGGDAIAGYKGGLMSARSLQDRGVREPLAGVLFASGALASGAEVSLCGYRRAAFEMKIGFVLSAPVSAPIASVQDLRALVSAAAPVVELPDIAYRDPASYGAIDMAAANISSARFVMGASAAPEAFDLNAVTAAMTRDGAALTQGLGRESLGDQWESLRTVINVALANGHGPLAAGALVLTGKIGDKGDIVAGAYVADYGAFGRVAFQVRDCAGR